MNKAYKWTFYPDTNVYVIFKKTSRGWTVVHRFVETHGDTARKVCERIIESFAATRSFTFFYDEDGYQLPGFDEVSDGQEVEG